ncbi:MAG: MFS transporter [Pseudomonadota bacterium]
MPRSSSASQYCWHTGLLLVSVGAAIALSISMGVRQSLGLFLTPMNQLAGISAASFGMAMAIQNLAWGISQPVTGYLADRFGSRIILLSVGPVYAVGLLLMAYGEDLGLLVGGGVLLGLAVSGSAFGVVLGAVSRAAADKTRALAVALPTCCSPIVHLSRPHADTNRYAAPQRLPFSP